MKIDVISCHQQFCPSKAIQTELWPVFCFVQSHLLAMDVNDNGSAHNGYADDDSTHNGSDDQWQLDELTYGKTDG